MADSELPEGAIPIATEQLLAAIGELYVQVRTMRQIIQHQQQQQQSAPKPANNAIHIEQ